MKSSPVGKVKDGARCKVIEGVQRLFVLVGSLVAGVVPSVGIAQPAAIIGGVFETSPGAIAVESGDRVAHTGRAVPLTAAVSLNLDASAPSMTAILYNAVLEGGEPFVLTVRSDLGTRLPDGSLQFTGDYLKDLHPSGSQYAFDWRFSPSDNGHLTWTGGAFWTGGHLWQVSIPPVLLSPGPALQITRNASRFTLSWANVDDAYRLERASGLFPSVWSEVTNAVVAVAGRSSVTMEAGIEPGFFRLRKTEAPPRAR